MYQSQSESEQLIQTITSNTKKLSQNVNSLKQMLAQLQNSPSSDNETLREQFHKTQSYTQQLATDTTPMLRQLPQENSFRIKRERLAKDFSDALSAFQNIQLKEFDQERAEIKRARAISQSNPADIRIRPPPGRQNAEVGYQQQTQQQALMMEEGANLEILREREAAVRVLEQNISDVNGMFKEIATIVHEQGSAIDSIEAHVDSTVIGVLSGAEELTQARTHLERSQRKKFCLIVTAIIFLAILIAIIVRAS